MAELRYGYVYFKDQNAGILRDEPGGGTVFSYAPDFKGTTIACALSDKIRSYSWPAGLHPFFQHITPEGWLRNRQARTAEIDTEDDFGLLLAYGYDCIGAVSIHAPEGKFRTIDDSALDAKTRAAVKVKKTISGIQPKLYVDEKDGHFYPAEENGPARWIAKFSSEDIPNMIFNEALSLRAAGLLLGPAEITQFQTGTIEGLNDPALLVKRFDRVSGGAKLRLEDFAQILCIPRGNDYRGKYNSSFEAAAKVIATFSARPQIDLLRFFRRIVTFFLLGNCDCHLKNWSLLETVEGLRLSPVYDVVNTYIYARQGYSTEFGLDIHGRKLEWDQINKTVLSGLGQDIGLNQVTIQGVYDEFLRHREKLLHLVEPNPSDDHLASAECRRNYADSVRSAYLRIE